MTSKKSFSYNIVLLDGERLVAQFPEPIDEQDWAPEGECFAKVDVNEICQNFKEYSVGEEDT